MRAMPALPTPGKTAASWLCALALALPGFAGAQVTRAEQLQYPPLRAFEIPQPQRVVLDNGLVVMLLEDHELPLVEVTALLRTGSRHDPADKLGLANLAATVLRAGGTAKLPSEQLDDYLESRAATIEVAAGQTSARAALTTLSQDFPDMLRVLADVLRRPAYEAERLEVERNRLVARVSRQNEDPGDIVFREFEEIVYGFDSPYGRTETLTTLRAIGRDDVVAWHREHIHPDRMVLGLVGDFKRDEALQQVREAFGDWPRGPAVQRAAIPYRKEPSPGVYYVEKNDVTQSHVLMGHLGVRRDDPDYYALDVANQVLSGSFSSRLFANVRTRKGLAYAVFGGVFSDWDHPGTAMLFLSTKTETTGAGIAALLEEARNLVEAQPPTPEEIAKAKQGLLNSFIFRSDSKQRILAQQLSFELYGYPLDWLSRYRAGIEAVTDEQVRRAAARHLRPEEFSIVVVGPAEGRDRPLTDFGPVTPVDITIAGADATPGHGPR